MKFYNNLRLFLGVILRRYRKLYRNRSGKCFQDCKVKLKIGETLGSVSEK